MQAALRVVSDRGLANQQTGTRTARGLGLAGGSSPPAESVGLSNWKLMGNHLRAPTQGKVSFPTHPPLRLRGRGGGRSSGTDSRVACNTFPSEGQRGQ